ncbi:MAG TPA: phosphatidate cytidylyltransferase, partial [Leptolinea sp.]
SGGDGLADIIGKRFGKTKLFWSKSKSWVGSAAMLFAGVGFALLVLFIFYQAGVFSTRFESIVLPVVVIGFICTGVESLPLEEFDNLTVPLTAVLLGHLLMPKG